MPQPTVPPTPTPRGSWVPEAPPPTTTSTIERSSPFTGVARGDRRRDPEWRETLVRRVRAEFAQMPGMRLTVNQAQRLFGLRGDICLRILRQLEAEGFLRCDRGAVFARRLDV